MHTGDKTKERFCVFLNKYWRMGKELELGGQGAAADVTRSPTVMVRSKNKDAVS